MANEPTATIPTDPSKRRTTAIFVLIILLAILISAAIYYQLNKQTASEKKTNNEATVQEIPTNENVTATPEPLTWKTATLEAYTIQYRSDASYAQHNVDGKIIDIWSADNFSAQIVSYPIDFKAKLQFTETKTSEKQIVVANQTTTKIIGTVPQANNMTLIFVGPLVKNNTEYLLVYNSNGKPATQDNLEVFDQMVASFTFKN